MKEYRVTRLGELFIYRVEMFEPATRFREGCWKPFQRYIPHWDGGDLDDAEFPTEDEARAFIKGLLAKDREYYLRKTGGWVPVGAN